MRSEGEPSCCIPKPLQPSHELVASPCACSAPLSHSQTSRLPLVERTLMGASQQHDHYSSTRLPGQCGDPQEAWRFRAKHERVPSSRRSGLPVSMQRGSRRGPAAEARTIAFAFSPERTGRLRRRRSSDGAAPTGARIRHECFCSQSAGELTSARATNRSSLVEPHLRCSARSESPRSERVRAGPRQADVGDRCIGSASV